MANNNNGNNSNNNNDNNGNNNGDIKIFTQLLKSDFIKSLFVIILTLMGFTWQTANFKNDLEKTITNIGTEIKVGNIILENRINKLEIKQQSDIDYIKDKFMRSKGN